MPLTPNTHSACYPSNAHLTGISPFSVPAAKEQQTTEGELFIELTLHFPNRYGSQWTVTECFTMEEMKSPRIQQLVRSLGLLKEAEQGILQVDHFLDRRAFALVTLLDNDQWQIEQYFPSAEYF